MIKKKPSKEKKMTQPTVFEKSLSHAMLYEVGGFWNLDSPGVREGLITTAAQRKACGYVNDPTDRGGETKYGIAKNANPDLDIAALDWEGAKRIYMKRYWFPADCEDIAAYGLPRLALLHFDGAVNHGVGRACVLLQQALNVPADGDIGPATMFALSSVNELATVDKICALRASFYRNIVESDPSQAKYLTGWMRRIDEIKEHLHGVAR